MVFSRKVRESGMKVGVGKDLITGEKMVRIFLFLFVLFLPFSITGTEISLGLVVVVWAGQLIMVKEKPFARNSLTIPILLYLGANVLGVIFSQDLGKSIDHSRSLWIILTFFIVFNYLQDIKTLRRLLTLLLVVFSLVGGYGILQHYLGVNTESFWKLGGNYPRATGFSGSVRYGAQLLLVFPIAVSLALAEKNWKKKGWYILSSLLLFSGILWCWTRGVWLGAVGALIVLGIMKGKKFLLSIILTLTVVVGSLLLSLPSFVDRVKSIGDKSEISISRTIIWRNTIRMIRDYPITGVGPGCYASVQEDYRLTEREKEASWRHAHNNLLQEMADNGIIGLLSYLWLWYIIFKVGITALRISGRQDYRRSVLLGIIAGLVGFHIDGMFHCNWRTSVVALLMWLIIGVMMVIAERPGAEAYVRE